MATRPPVNQNIDLADIMIFLSPLFMGRVCGKQEKPAIENITSHIRQD
jgi:hypothetical protein